jgi:predicted nucleic acid-binding protein
MRRLPGWVMCRIGYTETRRAIALATGGAREPARRFDSDWLRINAIEVTQELVEAAAELAESERLRTVDAIHLAAALELRYPDLGFASWDYQLHAAAMRRGFAVVPESLSK